MISYWGVKWDEKQEQIATGSVKPILATLINKSSYEDRWSNRTEIKYTLAFKVNGSNQIIKKTAPKSVWDTLKLEEQVEAYLFDDEYFIPRISTGGFSWGRWIFLLFGASPMLIGFTINYFTKKRKPQTSVDSNLSAR